MKFKIRPMTPEEQTYSYSQSPDEMQSIGCIGHLRGDMDTDGKGFFTSWDDHTPELKTDEFKAELDEFIKALRFDDQYGGILKNRDSLRAYCNAHPSSKFEGSYLQEYGFRAESEKYTYFLRCSPQKGLHNFYVYAYNREVLEKATTQLMNVLVVEPGKKPYEKAIQPGLSSLQHEVGGYIEIISPFEEPVALILDEEGKLKGKELNRALRDDEDNIYDAIAGTFIIAGRGDSDLTSLDDAYIKKFTEVFKIPEMFVRINGKIVVLPMTPVTLNEKIKSASIRASEENSGSLDRAKEIEHER